MIANIKRMGRTSFLSIAFGLALGGCVQKNNHVSPSAPPPAPPSMEYLDHTVQFSGETLAAIAQWYTGRSTNWMAIREANPGLNPNRLRLGQLIRIPDMLLMRRQPLPRDFLRKFNGGTERPAAAPDATEGSNTNGDPTGSTEASNPASTEATTPSSVTPGAEEGTKAPAVPSENTPPPATSNPAGNDKPSAGMDKPANEAATPEDAEREKLLDELLN